MISYKILLKTSSKILALDSQIYHDYSIPGTKPALLQSSKMENFPTIVDGYSRQLLFQSFPCEMSEVVLATPPHTTYILNCTVVYTAKLTVSCHTKVWYQQFPIVAFLEFVVELLLSNLLNLLRAKYSLRTFPNSLTS